MMRRSEDQYQNDPAFRMFADLAHKTCADGQLSPEEMRRAVMYGCYRAEMRRLEPYWAAPIEVCKCVGGHTAPGCPVHDPKSPYR